MRIFHQKDSPFFVENHVDSFCVCDEPQCGETVALNTNNLFTEKEKERGTTFYEVSFETKNYEYEYDISLKGKILKKEVERD